MTLGEVMDKLKGPFGGPTPSNEDRNKPIVGYEKNGNGNSVVETFYYGDGGQSNFIS